MKEYCTQNDGDCGSCSLVNYGRDCQNNPLSDVDLLEDWPRGFAGARRLKNNPLSDVDLLEDCLDSFGPEKEK